MGGVSKERLLGSWPAPLREVGEASSHGAGAVFQCTSQASRRHSRVPSSGRDSKLLFVTCWKSETVVSVLPEKDLVAVLGFCESLRWVQGPMACWGIGDSEPEACFITPSMQDKTLCFLPSVGRNIDVFVSFNFFETGLL